VGGATPAGVPIWVSGSFDPELNLIYYGTANEPRVEPGSRARDNLYSDSIVALDVKSGNAEMAFPEHAARRARLGFLETPVLIDATFRGQPRKLLVQANRNGFYYVLDRTDGDFLLGTPFVDQLDWATGLDAKGRPIVTPDTIRRSRARRCVRRRWVRRIGLRRLTVRIRVTCT